MMLHWVDGGGLNHFPIVIHQFGMGGVLNSKVLTGRIL